MNSSSFSHRSDSKQDTEWADVSAPMKEMSAHLKFIERGICLILAIIGATGFIVAALIALRS